MNDGFIWNYNLRKKTIYLRSEKIAKKRKVNIKIDHFNVHEFLGVIVVEKSDQYSSSFLLI